ncbi:MAG: energy-coupling factor transporter ATPase [Nitrososphaerota archaeon]
MEAINNQELRVVELSCRYNKHWVFRNVSFTVKPGEIVGVVGPSGSGKTTLACCLVGVIPKKIKAEVSGKIYVDGRDLSEIPFEKSIKILNMVLQSYDMQIFGLTVREDLLFTLENIEHDGEEIKRRLNRILKSFGLEKYVDYEVSELSGGLRQRLALASTILMNPKYIVLDDPTANLDWRGVKELANILTELKKNKHGVIIMGRRLKGFESIVDKVIYLNRSNTQNNSIMNSQNLPNDTVERNICEPVIQFRDVWFKYKRDFVLKNISLDIYRGESVTLMGLNGSGKTTLAKLINGLLIPVKGVVRVLGIDTKTSSPARMSRYVGFVFQDPDKHIIFDTVWDEVTFIARNIGLSFDYAEEALKLLKLENLRNEAPYCLSMGEKVRLSIASTLASNPEILIFDEPTTGQDEETLVTISLLIKKLKSKNKTSIIITHDSDFALEVSDRVIVMADGVIVADGSPKEILFNNKLLEEYGLEPPSILLSKTLEVG